MRPDDSKVHNHFEDIYISLDCVNRTDLLPATNLRVKLEIILQL